ncbi:(deoxy)nucleoside triphosphate pyrophosphohydrolase [Bryobacter aggregatus]|uniref:(deoxy)nucleoside triphosphate pyrophosphohydrolase n=1 Tax=Bryobacter aggregatus TaxID=360054 RepID=UPI0004E0BC89|nr:(deoxy)nucleoside triphosphate pyrophosphohydrolase [Bryobacter aggregatus]
MPKAVAVVAGVVFHGGRILIGQRKRNDWHGLKWEFPGGKIEVGETPEQALVRELREELGIEAVIGEMMQSYQFSYNEKPPVELTFYEVTQFTGVPVNYEFEQILWEEAVRLPDYDFLEGDRDFIEFLAKRG